MQFERLSQEHTEPDEPEDKSRRAFLGWLGKGAAAAAGAAFIDERVFAESERTVGTWQSGAKELKELVMRPGQVEVSKVFAPDASGVHGEWFTETNNRIDRVTVSQGTEEFIRRAIREKKQRVIKCHLHPPQPGEEPLRDEVHLDGEEYPESYPPSFMMSLNEGDAVVAWSTDNVFADKIQIEYKAFDRRGVWTYSVDYAHPFWQTFGDVWDVAVDASREINKTSEYAPIWQECVAKHSFGFGAFQDFLARAPQVSEVVRNQCEQVVAEYEAKLTKPFGVLLQQQKTANDEFVLRSSKQEQMDWRKVHDASAQLGVKLMFHTYEALDL